MAEATQDVAAPAPQANPGITVPTDSDASVTVAGTGAGDLATLAVPSEGPGVRTRNQTTVYEGQGVDNQVAVEPMNTGVRALIEMNSKDAPESSDFDLGGAVSQLKLENDGSVTLYDASGEAIGATDAPWAVDANGVSVADAL